MKWVGLLIMCVWSHYSFGEVLNFDKSGKLYVDIHKSWELKKDVFGFPFMAFSPTEMGQKSNLSFLASGESLAFDEVRMKKEVDDYKKIKTDWAEKVGAKILKTYPLSTNVNSKGHKIHKIGIDYSFNNKNYIETSYYIECRGKLYFSKSLLLRENSSRQKDVDEMIKGLDCE
ncbi:MAG: hypothetical protein Fur0010_02530 [Bdellovibrio sp.]